MDADADADVDADADAGGIAIALLHLSAGALKMSRPIRGQGGHLVFSIGPKKTNLVEDVEILRPVKFP